jgi:hypothetical protein
MMFSVVSFAAEQAPEPASETILQKVGVNDAIQNQVASLIEKSISAAEKTGEFLQEELPLLAKEFLTWKFYYAVFWGSVWVVFSLVFFISSAIMVYGVCRWKWEGEAIIVAVMVAAFGCIPLGAGLVHATDAIQIKVAPKVYLIEWAADKAKGRN